MSHAPGAFRARFLQIGDRHGGTTAPVAFLNRCAFPRVHGIGSDPPERPCDFVGVPRVCARLYAHQSPRTAPLAEAPAAPLAGPVRRAAALLSGHRVEAPLRGRS